MTRGLVNIPKASVKVGIISHELGHVIGLTHTQKRVDRDGYITFFVNNTGAAWVSQFDRDNHTYYAEWGTPFYYV